MLQANDKSSRKREFSLESEAKALNRKGGDSGRFPRGG